ncbi:hypothetical protein AVEN_180552-1 [Araneus ventricosus]|uniref:Endonuclease/exonuclease/phosphatase domain-containing protein n=1 Tax=Araneus ventricosus TaxID=182803 RepID=A0A4Y2FJ36_ARAVE|nr:hypothetical protein AVEN_180552-1 [Araneus ventricosus]
MDSDSPLNNNTSQNQFQTPHQTPLFNTLNTPLQKDIKILQINLARSRPANLFLHPNVIQIKPDIIVIQEPYTQNRALSGFPGNWTAFSSENLTATILIPNLSIKAVLLSQ